MLNLTELTDHRLLSFSSLLLVHGSQSSTGHVSHLGNEALLNPKEVVGVIASETNQLVDVLNGFGGDARVEPEFDVSIIGLQTHTNQNLSASS